MSTSTLYHPVEVDKFPAISSSPLDPAGFTQSVYDPRAGAVLVFTGVVRNNSHGLEALSLWYEAYPELAQTMLDEILAEAKHKWSLVACGCQHRIGELQIGEIAVVVVTTAIHRKEAYLANQYIIDRVKFELPIWKKEKYADGSNTWSQNCH